MPSLNTLKLQSAHTVWWERFSTINANQRLPHALLLIGPQHADIIHFAYQMAAAVLCHHETRSCGECKSCRLAHSKEHPDLYHVQPEKSGGIIKIDQIRELQRIAFNSPQLGDKRIVIIHPAEKMNIAAANALLKLLEEPPACLRFILIAEQISTLPSTILSRCQQWQLSNTHILDIDYLTMAESYQIDSERGKIFSVYGSILQDLLDLMSKKISVCGLASKWATYELVDLIWLMYLINAQMINYQLVGVRHEKTWTKPLHLLSQQFQPPVLFAQLDELNRIMKKLNQNIAINQLLTLENLLLGYCEPG